MRARQRHFNPKGAGAIAAYDARYISGLSDGEVVSTWSSRTGSNDATQTNNANRPLYETNELNGNPVVRFDGTNDRMTHGATLNNCLVVCVIKTANNGTQQRVFGSGTTSSVAAYTFIGNRSGVASFASNTFADSMFDTYAHCIVSYDISGTSITFNKNGASSNTATFTKYTIGNEGSYALLGAGGTVTSASNFLNGDIALLCVLDFTASAPMKKRLHHHSAFSFKIACN